MQQSASADSYAGKPLTQSEMRVLRLIVGGLSNKEIAQLLHRSIRTIENHRAHLMHKLGVNNSVELVKRAALPLKIGEYSESDYTFEIMFNTDYWFWSHGVETHFYTMSKTEKNKLIDNYPHVWTYEGVAWYVYE